MKTRFELTHIDEKKPPQGDTKITLSKHVVVYDKNKSFIGTDVYNLKLNRWLMNRETAKYWLEEVTEWVWKDATKEKPHCYETGDWDGKKSDLVICKDTEGDLHLACCYEYSLEEPDPFEWYDKGDFGLRHEVAYWKNIYG